LSAATPQIVITGAGLITPLGLSRRQTWSAILESRCGMGPLAAMEQQLPQDRDGGQCPDLPADFAPNLPREVRYLRRAIADALTDAGLQSGSPYSPDRCGILLGTTLHGMRAAGKFLRTGRYDRFADFLAGATLANASADFHFRGLNATTCSACSSSLGSIALAVSLLRAGQLDVIVAGGYDTISEYVYGGFNSLRLVARGPLRPFTRGREGMKLAEGYGIVVLEREEDATRRHHAPLATILGFGESADAHHLTQPHPEGEGAARAMSAALASADLSPDQIDLVAAHATGTPDNDAGEYAAMSRVFGKDLARVPVVAFKSHLGHTLGGAGAVELILSALCLREQIIPGCPNVCPKEIEFPNLRVPIAPAQPARLRATLNTSLGFGGANTCMILGPAAAAQSAERRVLSAEELPSNQAAPSPGTPGEGWGGGLKDCARPGQTPTLTLPRSTGGGKESVRTQVLSRLSNPPAAGEGTGGTESAHAFRSPVFITGVGVALPGAIGNEAFVALLNRPAQRIACDSGPIAESEYLHLLSARRVRRMSDYVKLTLAATMLACQDAQIHDIPAFAETCCAILGSTHGSTNYSQQYYRQIVDDGIDAANPMLFAEGVPNAAAAHLSLMLSLKGPCQTVIGTRTAGLDALRLAALRITSGEWDRAIVGAAEEYSMVVNHAYRQWGLYRGEPAGGANESNGFPVGCGAVTFVLESARSVQQRNARPLGRLTGAVGPLSLRELSPRCAAESIDQLSRTTNVLGSANGTWIDRMEAAVFRRSKTRRNVAALAGHLPECFSVTPMAALAAGLLGRRLPGVQQAARQLLVVGSDYTKLFTAIAVDPLQR
jgi:3-oxoacyl-[acyl-carrier-protein] synthase II